MVDISEVISGITVWTHSSTLNRQQEFSAVDLGRLITDGLRLHRRIRAAAEELSDPRAGLDVTAGRSVEALLSQWLAVAKRVAADVAVAESSGGGTIDGAAALDRSILYAQHALGLSAESANRQLDRIAREGFRRGVSTEDLRRELLQGRVGK